MNRDPDPPPIFAADPEARPPSGSEARRSLVGLVLSLALHAAPALLLLNRPVEIGPVSAGEHVIEIELVAAEAPAETPPVSEIPPVPVESPPPPQETPQETPQGTPPEAPSARSDPPLPLEEPPVFDETAFPAPPLIPDPVEISEEPARPPVDVVTAAAPSVEAAPLEQRSAIGEGYQAAVARHLARFRRLPAALPRTLREARVVLTFAIDPEGALVDAAILESSGFPVIDAEALAMVRRAQPFPPAQDGRTSPARFTVPVTYRIRQRS